MEMLPLSVGDFAGPESGKSIDAILRVIRDHLGMDASFVSEFRHGRRIFRNIQTASGFRFATVGASDPLEESYCHWIARGELPELIRDPADHPLAARLAVTAALPVGAHLGIPIRLRDGAVYGTFCCFNTTPDRSLTARDLATMRAFADLVAQQIQAQVDHERGRRLLREQIDAVLENGRIAMVFQPAIRIDRPEIAFVEALARFSVTETASPADWFSRAHLVGLGEELELLALDSALDHLRNLPERIALSINVSPETLLSPVMRDRLDALPVERLIVEISEHRPVADYQALADALDRHRKRGLRLAVDDAGAGHAGLRHILNLKPDIIKLGMSVTRGIDSDPVGRALASAMVQFAWSVGGQLVANGVESPGELATLRALGILFIQGHLCARPGPLEDLAIDPLAA